jgi:hypothetical protein
MALFCEFGAPTVPNRAKIVLIHNLAHLSAHTVGGPYVKNGRMERRG